MFGAPNPFGQSSSGMFSSQSAFGQTSNTNNNPFAAQPFGSSTSNNPFGAQTGSSIFGSTSTGVFGAAQSSSPFPSSTPAFGSTTPPFGASSSPAFTSSPSPFGSSGVGQKPAFGAFGSNPAQPSPFGSTSQPSQPAFGSNLFGSSTPFGATSTPAFGATSTPAFGATSTPAFGVTNTPAFGATNTQAFGVTNTPAFGSTSNPAFGSTSNPAFGAPSTPAFGSTSSPAFGSTGSTFGASSAPAFGTSGSTFVSSNNSPFGASSTPGFGSNSTPNFNLTSTPAFGQSSSTFGTQSSPFGSQPTTFGNNGTFGQPAFGGQQHGGSRVVAYAATPEPDAGGGPAVGKLESISAMAQYKEKSHEELRWEDYQSGDKGGPAPAGGGGFGMPTSQLNPFNTAPSSQQTSTSPFSIPQKTPSFPSTGFSSSSLGLSTSSSVFAPSSSPSFLGQTSSPALFTSSSSSAFSFSTPAPTAPTTFNSGLFNSTAPIAQTGSNIGVGSSTSAFGQNTTPFGQGTSPFGQNTAPFGQNTAPFGQNTAPFGQNTAPFGQNTAPFGQNTSPFGKNTLSNTSNGIGVGSSSTLTSPSNPTGFSQPANTGFSFSNFNQTQSGNTSAVGVSPGIFGQNNFGQVSATQSSVAVQPVPATSPYGSLPAMPQMSIGRGGTSPSIQYGISSMPVVDKPAPARISSLLTSRHLSQRRVRLPARKYNPRNDDPRFAFFIDDEETVSTPKPDALFLPRENPRALVIRPKEQWPLRASAEKASPLNDTSSPVQENGKLPGEGNSNSEDKDKTPQKNGIVKERVDHVNANQKPNGVHDDHSIQKGDSYMTLSGHRAGEAAIAYEHGAEIESLMPKLRRSDYYTEPRIQELAAKERAESGFCSRVKDFVVGRIGYGSIKFLGETDVRGLDLESLVQFNNREVIVYPDDNRKPPVGQGLNKPAEVTLLNITCTDKKTGHQFTEGPKTERYKQMLKKKAEDQGTEFVSYDALKAEWKFRVKHFSAYELGSEDDWDVEAAQD